MKRLIAFLALAAFPAHATAPVSVPEIDVGAGVAALAILIGVAAVVREKFFRK